MDKTLETVTLIHRPIIAGALALFLVGISTEHPKRVYDEATNEIQSLQEGIEAVSEQVDHAYKAIYDKSDLKLTTLAWLRRHHSEQQDLYIEVVNPADFVVPDSTRDPLVTLDAQLKWANRVYRELEYPFFLCQVDPARLRRALDTVVGFSAKPKLTQLSVYVLGGTGAAKSNQQLSCKIEVRYEVQKGTIIGLRSAVLDIPSTVVDVTQVEPPGPKWFDLSVENTFKEHELGDWEDSKALVVPNLWALWTDLGSRSPSAAEAFLQQKKEEEAEKSKEKLEILGQSLNRTMTILMAAIVELCLLIYLLVHVFHVRVMAPDHGTAISESPFYGIMRTRLGRVVILCTFAIPFGVCFFVLIVVFPSLRTEWLGPHWITTTIARWFLVASVGITDLFLILQIYRTIDVVQAVTRDAQAKAAGAQ